MLWLCSGRLTLADNVLGINEGGMVNGVLSRKVEITLNSAVSLVQAVQPHFLYLMLALVFNHIVDINKLAQLKIIIKSNKNERNSIIAK